MQPLSLSKFALLYGLVAVVTTQVHAAQRGLAWAVDDRWATAFNNSVLTWYHHWELSTVKQMPSTMQYVPTLWGPAKANYWKSEVASWNGNLPQYILAYNEPDVPSQANMTPQQAVDDFMTNLQPYRLKGVKVSSPQIVWNVDWMTSFINGLQARGGDVDFMALHYYGAWYDNTTMQAYVERVYNRFGKEVWLTEVATTQSAKGTQDDQASFMNMMLAWADKQSYIERVVFNGAWSATNPPDDYINAECGFYYANATLRPIGKAYASGTPYVPIPSTPAPTSTSTTSSSISTTLTSTTTLTTSVTATSTKTSVTATSTTFITTSSTTPTVCKPTSTTTSTTTTTTSKPTTTVPPTTTPVQTTTTATSTSTTTPKKCSRSVRLNRGNVVSEAKRREQEERRIVGQWYVLD